MAFCDQCGARLQAKAKFCAQCGAKQTFTSDLGEFEIDFSQSNGIPFSTSHPRERARLSNRSPLSENRPRNVDRKPNRASYSPKFGADNTKTKHHPSYFRPIVMIGAVVLVVGILCATILPRVLHRNENQPHEEEYHPMNEANGVLSTNQNTSANSQPPIGSDANSKYYFNSVDEILAQEAHSIYPYYILRDDKFYPLIPYDGYGTINSSASIYCHDESRNQSVVWSHATPNEMVTLDLSNGDQLVFVDGSRSPASKIYPIQRVSYGIGDISLYVEPSATRFARINGSKEDINGQYFSSDGNPVLDEILGYEIPDNPAIGDHMEESFRKCEEYFETILNNAGVSWYKVFPRSLSSGHGCSYYLLGNLGTELSFGRWDGTNFEEYWMRASEYLYTYDAEDPGISIEVEKNKDGYFILNPATDISGECFFETSIGGIVLNIVQ